MTRDLIAKTSPDMADIEKKVGLPEGFIVGLIDEGEDWSFVVKTCVVLEAALNAVLAEISPGHDLARFVGQLPLQGRSGKLALAVAAGVMDARSEAAFSAIAAIRNRFVHSLSGLAGTLDSYAKQLTLQQRIDFRRTMLNGDSDDLNEMRTQSVEAFTAELRERIWWCAACLLMDLILGDLKNAQRRMKYELGEMRTGPRPGELNGLLTLANLAGAPPLGAAGAAGDADLSK